MALTLVRVRPHGWRGPKNLCVTIPDQIGSSTFLGDTKGSGLYVRRWASTHFNLHRRWRTKDPGQSVLNLCFSRGFVSLCFLMVDSCSLAIQFNPIRLLARTLVVDGLVTVEISANRSHANSGTFVTRGSRERGNELRHIICSFAVLITSDSTYYCYSYIHLCKQTIVVMLL